jgi:DNA-binding NarL/FixJ family response regulator
LFGAAETLREAIGVALLPAERADHDRAVAAARAGAGEVAFAAAWAEGRRMTLEQAAEYALAITTPSTLAAVDRSTAAAGSPGDPEVTRLTLREREIAALVARGLTNRRIAHELVLSERTVDTHVHHILGKLALSSRAQIAAWSVEHGLTGVR